ncbi:outer membrane beta-barrel protein [Larkinella insperata]|uniref:Outer membrane beta-barrel protein n=1 Tax=Larkinella insperata TaxID=332158 RepID=A0ABW3QCC7_9BACT|nr:outer membrane beta-barrel protein [Larkinella insperata]
MKFFGVVWIVLLMATTAQAQGTIALGVRGGGTFMHGFTTIPARTLAPGLEIPKIRNENNGIGTGYLGGVWVRKTFSRFFLQAEVSYSKLALKQKANIDRIDVAAASEFGVTIPNIPVGTLFANLNTTSDPVLNSVNIPVYIGKQGQEGKWRIYGGPTFLFTQKSEAARTASGQVGPNPSFPVSISDKVDLTDPEQAGILQVKNFNFGVELGAGLTLLKRLEVDLRYGLPVGGVFNDSGITGYIGYATIAVGYRLFDF